MRDAFSTYHPLVNFLYFTLMLAFSMIFMHPVCLTISLVCALAYSLCIHRRKAVKFSLVCLLPTLLLTALINPALNHEGNTILTYMGDGNPLTLESIVYGIAAGVMLITVITWFSCFNAVITSDKFVYLFGRILPAFSLVLSLSLRFVPRFKAQIKTISHAQKCIGRDVSNGGVLRRARQGIRILSIAVTWALENAVETADSMKSRGYGLAGRTAFSLYRFDGRDAKALVFLLCCGLMIVPGSLTGALNWRYFPTLRGDVAGVLSVLLYITYFALCILPTAIHTKEALTWRALRSKA